MLNITIMSNPKRLAEGSYGCVHNPPLKCKDGYSRNTDFKPSDIQNISF